jgi:hypothetical protein
MTLCSIVVAAFNVERFLPTCIESLLAQSLTDIEILVVNDGSTDGTGEIAAGYAARDARVKVIDRPNGGLSAARNSGLDAAEGRYVAFLDGDDWAEPDLVEQLTGAAAESGAAVVIAGCYIDVHDRHDRCTGRSTQLPPSAVIDAQRPLRGHEARKPLVDLVGYAWNKLYARELLEAAGLRFEEGLSLVEDIVFNAAALTRASRVALVPSPHVHYIRRPRVTLGTALYPNYLELRLRAIDCQVAILEHWGLPATDVGTVKNTSAVNSILGAVRLVASQAGCSHRSRVAMLRTVMSVDDHRRSGASWPTAPRLYDRVVLALVAREHYGMALGVVQGLSRFDGSLTGMKRAVRRRRRPPPRDARRVAEEEVLVSPSGGPAPAGGSAGADLVEDARHSPPNLA